MKVTVSNAISMAAGGTGKSKQVPRGLENGVCAALKQSVLAGGRLPSFRAQRDLSLGAFNRKKTYTPNLAAARDRNHKTGPSPAPVANHKKAEGREKRGRGRGKEKQLIQLGGAIFGEGVADTGSRKPGRWSSSGGKESIENLPKPKINLTDNKKLDKDEESAQLESLLRDDFLDDPDMDTDDVTNLPVQLPVIMSQVGKQPTVKREPGEEAGDKEKDLKMTKMAEGKNEIRPRSPNINLADAIKCKDDHLFLLQLPDCLPSQAEERLKPPASAEKEEPEKEAFGLAGLGEGPIGKLQIMKSGKMRLVIQNEALQLEPGSQIGTLEELMMVKFSEDSRSGEMSLLGHVKQKYVASPDWEHLVQEGLR